MTRPRQSQDAADMTVAIHRGHHITHIREAGLLEQGGEQQTLQQGHVRTLRFRQTASGGIKTGTMLLHDMKPAIIGACGPLDRRNGTQGIIEHDGRDGIPHPARGTILKKTDGAGRRPSAGHAPPGILTHQPHHPERTSISLQPPNAEPITNRWKSPHTSCSSHAGDEPDPNNHFQSPGNQPGNFTANKLQVTASQERTSPSENTENTETCKQGFGSDTNPKESIKFQPTRG